jgi:hypothetical protein
LGADAHPASNRADRESAHQVRLVRVGVMAAAYKESLPPSNNVNGGRQ